MPIYQYRCSACGELTEVWAKMSDPPPAACEHCEASESMEKMVSRTAFHLKGGGWYAQGYGSSGKAGSGGKSESAPSKSTASSESSGSTKASAPSTSSGD